MKYLLEFENVTIAREHGALGLDSPHVDYIVDKRKSNLHKTKTATFTCSFNEGGKIINAHGTAWENDKIWTGNLQWGKY